MIKYIPRAILALPLVLVCTPAIAGDEPLAWGKKVKPAFRTKVRAITKRLGLHPDHLMAIMAFETNRTFSPKQTNKTSKAIGLIQFMPSTAKALGTTSKKLALMSAVEQLDYVERHFQPYAKKKKLGTLTDAHLAVLYPAAMGEGEDHVVFDGTSKSKGELARYKANRWLDKDKDLKVTRKEITAFLQRFLKDGKKPANAAR